MIPAYDKDRMTVLLTILKDKSAAATLIECYELALKYDIFFELEEKWRLECKDRNIHMWDANLGSILRTLKAIDAKEGKPLSETWENGEGFSHFVSTVTLHQGVLTATSIRSELHRVVTERTYKYTGTPSTPSRELWSEFTDAAVQPVNRQDVAAIAFAFGVRLMP